MTTDTDVRSIDHPIGPDGVFLLHVESGDAHLRGTDGEDVTVRSTDGDPLTGLHIERGERSLAIRSRNGDERRRRAGALDLTIDVPRTATVVVEAGSADVVADGLAGDSRLMTASGDLTIRDVRGSLAVEAVSGDVEIQAPESLTVAVRTVSGDLDLRAGTLHALRAATTSGDVTVVGRLAGDGPFSLETVSGDASLEPIGDLRIEFTTLTGDIRGRGIGRRSARDRAPIVIGSGGGPTLAFRSTSGDLAVSPRPDTEPGRATEPIATATATATTPVHDNDDERLEILRSLERGEIDVDVAKQRLAELDTNDDRAAATDADDTDRRPPDA